MVSLLHYGMYGSYMMTQNSKYFNLEFIVLVGCPAISMFYTYIYILYNTGEVYICYIRVFIYIYIHTLGSRL